MVIILGRLCYFFQKNMDRGINMLREYEECDVYESLQQRLKLIFEEFDNIYVSFSGERTAACC